MPLYLYLYSDDKLEVTSKGKQALLVSRSDVIIYLMRSGPQRSRRMDYREAHGADRAQSRIAEGHWRCWSAVFDDRGGWGPEV